MPPGWESLSSSNREPFLSQFPLKPSFFFKIGREPELMEVAGGFRVSFYCAVSESLADEGF